MSTAEPFVASFYPIDQRTSNKASIMQPESANRNHLVTAKSVATSTKPAVEKHLVSVGYTHKKQQSRSTSSNEAMVSISPIRFDRHTKPSAVCTTKTPKANVNSTVPPTTFPAMSVGSSVCVKNLSNQFVGEKTPGFGLSSITAEDGAPIKQEDDYDLFSRLDTNCNSPLLNAGAGAATNAPPEHNDLDANLDISYYNSVPTLNFLPATEAAADTTGLDDWSLHSNGSFDLGTFPSTETEESTIPIGRPDPKGIFAMKAIRMRPNTNKPKKKSRKADDEGGVLEPTHLDILKGRGGLTNRHPGNMRFRDEARALRDEYRHISTTRQEKFQISQRLVDIVKDYGGRFLEKGDDGLWYRISAKAERKKASQVLREEKWD